MPGVGRPRIAPPIEMPDLPEPWPMRLFALVFLALCCIGFMWWVTGSRRD